MRLLAIGDIHGCLLQFNALLDLVRPAADDQLILLGDYVDRGPDSRGVLDRILELKAGGMNLVSLRGNHEVMMMASRHDPEVYRSWLSEGGSQTLGSYGRAAGRSGSMADVPAEHWNLIVDGMHTYHETEGRIFVHAGINRELPMAEQHPDVLYWEYLWDDMRHCSGKTVICGHSAQKNGLPKVVPGAVCIDTFAYGGGWLTCLDALTGRYWQVNFMGKPREGRIDEANGAT